jgi:hypothetical protein
MVERGEEQEEEEAPLYLLHKFPQLNSETPLVLVHKWQLILVKRILSSTYKKTTKMVVRGEEQEEEEVLIYHLLKFPQLNSETLLVSAHKWRQILVRRILFSTYKKTKTEEKQGESMENPESRERTRQELTRVDAEESTEERHTRDVVCLGLGGARKLRSVPQELVCTRTAGRSAF